jgi:SAM-dependent methyltransferase
MKNLGNPFFNLAYLFYRLVSPVFDPYRFFRGLTGYAWYFSDLIKFQKLNREIPVSWTGLYPVLDEKRDLTPFDAHYFYQELWAFAKIVKNKPNRHVDIASKYQFSGFLSHFVRTEFIDIQPVTAKYPNLKVVRGDALSLPYKNNSVKSVSCLHVIEHIGLGRYGDTVDPEGAKKAAGEITRILSPGGRLYLSTPVGKEAVYFNAHRVFHPDKVRKMFSGLQLAGFAAVDDSGRFYKRDTPEKYQGSSYALGMFEFIKPDQKR